MNSKKLRRLMCEHGLQPKRRWRYVVTTDSDHAGPIYPDLAKDVAPDHPNQLSRAAARTQRRLCFRQRGHSLDRVTNSAREQFAADHN